MAAGVQETNQLLRQLELGYCQFLLAIDFFHRAGGLNLFAFFAKVFVEIVAYFVFGQVVSGFLTVLGGLDHVLAFIRGCQRALCTFTLAGYRHFFFVFSKRCGRQGK